jgi:hypothetical protein
LFAEKGKYRGKTYIRGKTDRSLENRGKGGIISCESRTEEQQETGHDKKGGENCPDHGGNRVKFPGSPGTAGEKEGRVKNIVDYPLGARPELISRELDFFQAVSGNND